MPQARVPKILKRIGNFGKKRIKEKKKSGGWLPDSYEIRKEQAQFVEEASKAIENNNVFLGMLLVE